MVRQRCVNPFYHRIELRPIDWLWVIPGSIILVPIRIILVLLLFLIASFLSKLCNLFLNTIDKTKDPDKFQLWRIRFKNVIIHLFRSILFVCGFYKITVIEKGDPSKEVDAPIYVFAPHTSLFDILSGVAFGAPSSVAKADIINIPLFGNIFKLSDPVLVERDSKDSRHDVFKKVAEVIKYSKIVFFPEGTCSNHRGLLQFKNGAFKFGYPVIPVALRFNQHGSPDTLSWTWDGPNTIWSIWLTLARWRTDLELTKLAVYYPSKEEKANPELYAANISKILVQELKLPCLYYTYDDARYFKYDFFRSSTCVKFLKLVDKIRQTHETDNETNSNSNGTIAATKNDNKGQKKNTVSYTSFLYDFIDAINDNLTKVDLKSSLDQKELLKLMNIDSIPKITDSWSVKELMTCLQKPMNDPKAFYLKLIIQLIDLRVENLWDRMRSCYETLQKYDHQSSVLSFDNLKILLWLSLSLDDVDQDEEIKNIQIMSFDDLKNLLKNYYDFALRENACSIYRKN